MRHSRLPCRALFLLGGDLPCPLYSFHLLRIFWSSENIKLPINRSCRIDTESTFGYENRAFTRYLFFEMVHFLVCWENLPFPLEMQTVYNQLPTQILAPLILSTLILTNTHWAYIKTAFVWKVESCFSKDRTKTTA